VVREEVEILDGCLKVTYIGVEGGSDGVLISDHGGASGNEMKTDRIFARDIYLNVFAGWVEVSMWPVGLCVHVETACFPTVPSWLLLGLAGRSYARHLV
jgi:hypothetical protein